MKIFDDRNGWTDRVNFVDKNNVFVGFDMSSTCCEDYGWFLSYNVEAYDWKTPANEEFPTDEELESYIFSTTEWEDMAGDFDSGSGAVFKLVATGKPDLYLHIYNCHNGYYSHGLVVKKNENTVDVTYL